MSRPSMLRTAKVQLEQTHHASVAKLEAMLAEARLQNAEMSASTSWRVTLPLRAVGDAGKRLARSAAQSWSPVRHPPTNGLTSLAWPTGDSECTYRY
jgi:hypothetical protein